MTEQPQPPAAPAAPAPTPDPPRPPVVVQTGGGDLARMVESGLSTLRDTIAGLPESVANAVREATPVVPQSPAAPTTQPPVTQAPPSPVKTPATQSKRRLSDWWFGT